MSFLVNMRLPRRFAPCNDALQASAGCIHSNDKIKLYLKAPLGYFGLT